MKIGIDVSQLAYKNLGVSNYLQNLVEALIKEDKKNEYVLFFSSLRKKFPASSLRFLDNNPRVQIKTFKIPPTVLDFLWNRLHIIPIEDFIGDVDIFITSDWTEPPAKHARKVTILYDLIIYKYPNETHRKIIDVQKRKLKWVRKESDKIICISNASRKDAMDILGIPSSKLSVAYPGF